MTELLSAKIWPPRVPAGLVARPALIAALRAGTSGRLTLLSAPPGYGKTTLAAAALEGIPRRVAWVTLDEGDNDPVQFWRYLTAALAASGAIGQPASRPAGPGRSAVIGLINELAGRPDPCVLVLDDYHLIEAPAVHRSFEQLLEHLPPHAHVVVATRVDPPLPLPRLRARGELTELRVVELRFTADEAAILLNETMGLGLTAGQVATLEERTEGWAAGLRLAGLSIGRQPDAESFVAAFGATHRYVLDYLTEEVLRRQDDDLRDFMIHTAVLDRLCAPLCDAVTGRTDSNRLLPHIEATNLFVLPLDDERRWYRYHRLFADLLRLRLREHDRADFETLHARASRWFEQQGAIEDAARHALSAGDPVRAATLLEQEAISMVTSGRTVTVRTWLNTLPDDAVRSRPMLAVWGAWACFLLGDVDETRRLVCLAEEVTPEHGADEAAALLAVKAFVSRALGDLRLSLELSSRALALLPPHETLVRSLVTFNLSVLHTFGGDIAVARRLGEEALTLARDSPPFWDDAVITGHLARVAIHSGRLHDAEYLCRGLIEEGLGLSGNAPPPVLAHVYASLGSVDLERNRLDDAADLYERALALGEASGELAAAFSARLGLSRIAFARGDTRGAREALEKADRTLPTGLAPWVRPYLVSWRARLAACEGDHFTALTLAERAEATSSSDQTFAVAAFPGILNVVRVRLAAGLPSNLLDRLHELADRTEREGRLGLLIEVLAVRATALAAEARGEEALLSLEQALQLAEPEGYTRTFLDEGERVAALLRALAAQGRGGGQVGRLLAAAAQAQTPAPGAGRTGSARRRRALELGLPPPPTPLLSQREVQILHLLAQGRSNREIAAELYLAEGTVKKHVYNVCTKLGAARRSHAVARARELGLL